MDTKRASDDRGWCYTVYRSGPGKVLQGLVLKINKEVAAESVS